jgi:hypothetical protein
MVAYRFTHAGGRSAVVVRRPIAQRDGANTQSPFITLAARFKQATSIAAAGEKALAFTAAKRNIDLGAGDTLADFTVASNTFTTDSTNSKNLMYVIDVKAEDLDVNGGFDCIRAGTGDATAATVTVLYMLYGAKFSTQPSAVVD